MLISQKKILYLACWKETAHKNITDASCLVGPSSFQHHLQSDLLSAFRQLPLISPSTAATTEPSPDLTARWEEPGPHPQISLFALVELRNLVSDQLLHSQTHDWTKLCLRVHDSLFLFSESDLDDCRFPCQGNSPRESLSSQYVSFLLVFLMTSFGCSTLCLHSSSAAGNELSCSKTHLCVTNYETDSLSARLSFIKWNIIWINFPRYCQISFSHK